MLFFYDNRDNADNGLSATRTELTLEALWIYGLRGAGNLQDLRDFVSEASGRKRNGELNEFSELLRRSIGGCPQSTPFRNHILKLISVLAIEPKLWYLFKIL